MTTLLLSGATGLVGAQTLALLLADARVTHIVAPTRRALPPHPKLENPLVEADALPTGADWWAVDGAICALGTTRAKAGSAGAFRAIDHDYVLEVAAQVKARGCRRFALVSAIGANAASPLLYPRTKGEVEQAVVRLGFPSLTILRPGLLGGARAEHRPLEKAAERFLAFAAPILPAAARINPATTVAHLLVEAAIGGTEGRHMVTAADISRAASVRV
ncbi:MAG: NAD-dependent dehydratase [Sphingobium sp.]